MNTKKTHVIELCQIAMFAAVISACALISIPMPYGVPLTLQTFGVQLAGVVLGARKGALAVIIYILLGAVGLPVFANMTGGIGIIFGRTGGFILSFPLMALAAGVGASLKKYNYLWLTLWLIIGAVINYICGVLMFSFVTGNGLIASVGFVVLPFLPTAALKVVLVVIAGKPIRTALYKIGVLP